MGNLDVALALAAAGIATFPCQPGGSDAKKPCRGVFWRKESTTDLRAIERWWTAWPDAAPAIDLAKAGLLVIDADRHGGPDGVAIWDELSLDHDVRAPTVDTPSGGKHVYFRQPDGLRLGNSRGSLPKGIDVRGDGGYVLAPGAVMADGRTYAAHGALEETPPLPDWLADLLQSKGGDADDALHRGPAAGHATQPLSPQRPPSQAGGARIAAYAEAGFAAEIERVRSAGKGERNNVLNAAAFALGQMVGAGWVTEAEASSALESAAADCGLVKEDGIRAVRATIRSGLTGGARKPRETPPDIEPQAATLDGAEIARNLVAKDGERYDADTGEIVEDGGFPTEFRWHDPTHIPRRSWVYGHHLISRFLSATVAPGGIGKSSLLIAEALAMATGRQLLGEAVHGGPKRVWLWNGEDPRDELTRRLMAACRHYAIEPSDFEGRLFVDTGRETEIVLAGDDRREGVKFNEKMIARLEAAIVKHGIEVVILDPFVSTHRLSENDNQKIDQLCRRLSAIADKTGIAIDLVHHVRKNTTGGDTTVEDARGASSLLAAVRSARVLNRMTEDEAAKLGVSRWSFIRVDNGKANLAPPAEHATWRQIVSVPLGNGSGGLLDDQDHIGVVTPWEKSDPEEALDDEAFKRIQDEVLGGVWRMDVRSPQWIGRAVALALEWNADLPDVRTDIKAIVSRMLKQGLLRIVEGVDEKRKKREFVEVGKPA